MDKLKQTMTDKGCVGSVKFSDEDGVPLAKCRRSQLDFYEGETREALEVDFGRRWMRISNCVKKFNARREQKK